MEVNVPGGPPKKRMSTGCMVALIVGIALVVIVVVGGVLCYTYREDLVKAGATAGIQAIQTQMQQDPQPGVDTALVNRVCNAYVERLQTEEGIDLNSLALVMQDLQQVPKDKVVDSVEAAALVSTMVQMYPDLESLARPEPALDTLITDSADVEL